MIEVYRIEVKFLFHLDNEDNQLEYSRKRKKFDKEDKKKY